MFISKNSFRVLFFALFLQSIIFIGLVYQSASSSLNLLVHVIHIQSFAKMEALADVAKNGITVIPKMYGVTTIDDFEKQRGEKKIELDKETTQFTEQHLTSLQLGYFLIIGYFILAIGLEFLLIAISSKSKKMASPGNNQNHSDLASE